jgi:hypothetical protein
MLERTNSKKRNSNYRPISRNKLASRIRRQRMRPLWIGEFLAQKASSEAYRLQAKLSDPDEECLELAGAYNPEELRKESPENMQHLPQARFDLTSDIPSTSVFSTSDLHAALAGIE